MRMEDFGLLKGSGIGFEDLWEGQSVISERALERDLNEQGLRFKMNRTAKEAEEVPHHSFHATQHIFTPRFSRGFL